VNHKLCFATSNLHKLEEVRRMLPNHQVLGLKDIDCQLEVPEDYETLRENSLQKARFINEHYKLDCFADDSGLEVLALNGAPGVHSAYYGGPERSASLNIKRLLNEMQSIDRREARFVTVITLILDGSVHVFEGELKGAIAFVPKGSGGFGYDPIFIPEGQQRTLAEMSMEEKNRISHRARAIQKLVNFLSLIA